MTTLSATKSAARLGLAWSNPLTRRQGRAGNWPRTDTGGGEEPPAAAHRRHAANTTDERSCRVGGSERICGRDGRSERPSWPTLNDALEDAAAEIVRQVLAGDQIKRRDGVPGAPPGIHDFDLEFADGSRVAVEVTTATDSPLRELWAAVSDRCWTFPGLQRSWSLVIRHDTRVDALHRAAGTLLAELERLGIYRVNAYEPDDARATKLATLGVRYARAVEESEQPIVFVGTVGLGDWYDGSDICEAVEREAAKTDNVRKLLAAGGGELFVWVDHHAANAHAALSGVVTLPTRSPRLPDAVTAVWAARCVLRPDRSIAAAVVLRGHPTAAWSDVTHLITRV